MNMNYKYEYESIRPKLWEIKGKNGRAVGRIRHVFSANAKKVGWQASNGKFYDNAQQAAIALVSAKVETVGAL
jgi:hypothetical protein